MCQQHGTRANGAVAGCVVDRPLLRFFVTDDRSGDRKAYYYSFAERDVVAAPPVGSFHFRLILRSPPHTDPATLTPAAGGSPECGRWRW